LRGPRTRTHRLRAHGVQHRSLRTIRRISRETLATVSRSGRKHRLLADWEERERIERRFAISRKACLFPPTIGSEGPGRGAQIRLRGRVHG
jgi:hypothetical protein